MTSINELRHAIDSARAGRTVEARDLLIQIVEKDPGNEAAWIWLSGLVDTIEDKIVACENALTINPDNEKIRTYLLKLQKEQEESRIRMGMREAQELLRQSRDCAENGNLVRAVQLARQSTQKSRDYEEAWLFLADLISDVHQRISVLERAREINPSNMQTVSMLEQARQLRDDPLGVAAHYEQAGNFDEALKLYNELASRIKDSKEFDRIYRHILRIEALQKEKIQYVAPRTSIVRLAVGWPLLYFFLLLVQVGLNPFAHPALHLWLGLPIVAIGSFFLSLSEIRSKHIFWEKIFLEQGDGSSFARIVTAVTGWILVIFPYVILLMDSVNRLQHFKIPLEPF
jgi:tetratricopeptide (TPR) repeat protein